jgi:hypothetical protein
MPEFPRTSYPKKWILHRGTFGNDTTRQDDKFKHHRYFVYAASFYKTLEWTINRKWSFITFG